MEVRKGYKETEVGIAPNDWSVKNIGSLAKVVGGGTPRTERSNT